MFDPTLALPALLFADGTATRRRELLALKEAGRIHPIGPRLSTSLPAESSAERAELAEVVRQQWRAIVAELFPEALLSHRTALELRPSPLHEIFLTAHTNRVIEYPGLRLHFLRGPAALPDDPWVGPPSGGLRASSRARMLLENLGKPRSAGIASRVSLQEVEARLAALLDEEGAGALHQLRERAGQLADELGWGGAFKRLDDLVATLLGRLLGARLFALAAPARVPAGDEPGNESFDPVSLARLQRLAAELQGRSFPQLVEPFPAVDAVAAVAGAGAAGASLHARHKAFFEAYFSSALAGVRFELAEAEAILFERELPSPPALSALRRPDALELRAAFQLASEPRLLEQPPRDAAELVQLLCARHARLMEPRPEALPGAFQEPALVLGTLRKAFELHAALPAGLPRALFVHGLLLDIKPFADGNGRLARAMMNAELRAAGLATAMIPTALRDDYQQAVRAWTRRDRPASIVEVLITAQQLSALDFSSYADVLAELVRRHWFREPHEARIAP